MDDKNGLNAFIQGLRPACICLKKPTFVLDLYLQYLPFLCATEWKELFGGFMLIPM